MTRLTTAPTLTTDHLTLRAHTHADFEAYAAFFASSRADHIGRLKRRHAWYSFASDVAQWALFGFGAWGVEDRTGRFIGQIAILKPDQFPEVELGWFLMDGFEGQGLAFEAATAARNFAFDTLGLPTLVSYIAPANSRSIALATRLGASLDTTAKSDDPDDLVYRYSTPAKPV